MKKVLPYGKQYISEEDINVVIESLKGDYLTQGTTVNLFEEAFAHYIGCEYAVAVSNGTAALHLCAMALEVGVGSKVLTTPITFAASSNCVKYCGGDVEFVDIDPKNYLVDIEALRHKLNSHPKGTFSGVIPVDFAGRAVNLEEIKKLADEFNLWIIEDACHAPGGFFVDSDGSNQNCGNGKFADLAIFSFHPVKHIATGEGGMITTNNEALYHKLLKLRTHGITKDRNQFVNSTEMAIGTGRDTGEYPGWYMEMQELGYNYRITDFQCALGISQLKRANCGIERRKEIAKRYEKAFENHKNIIGQSGFIEGHAYHLYVVEVEDRLGLYNYLRSVGIYAQVHYIPTHLMPYYRGFGWKEGDLPKAESYYKRCLSLPMFPTLSDGEQDRVIDEVKKYYFENNI